MANNPPSWPVDHHAVENGLDRREVRGDVLPQAIVVAKCLRLDAADDSLRLSDQIVELFVGAHVELPKTVEELDEEAGEELEEEAAEELEEEAVEELEEEAVEELEEEAAEELEEEAGEELEEEAAEELEEEGTEPPDLVA